MFYCSVGIDDVSNWDYISGMRENIYAYVMSNFDARVVPLARVSRETSIPYESLKKIAHRRTLNPGVKHVQALADFFDACAETAAQSPARIAPAATGTVAQGVAHV